jgi:hypothetical protein
VARAQKGAIAIEVDVAAADDDADAFALKLIAHLAGSGKAQATSRFNHDFHPLREEAHGLHELRIGHGENVIDVVLNDGKRVSA